MKVKVLSAVSLLFLVLNSVGFVVAGTPRKKGKTGQTNRLVAQLPDSDAVAVLDARRFFDDALPKLLASRQPILNEITAKLDQIQRHIGIDLRRFDQLAIGLKINQIAENQFDCDPVLIARGTYSAGALVSVARLASNGAYREEKIGERSIYIFSARDIADKKAAKAANTAGISGAIERTVEGISREIAIGSIDANTLVIGSPARVRQTFEGKTGVAADVTSLLTLKERAVFSFASRTPEGMSRFVPLDNDELGSNLESIRYLAGWMDVAAGSASIQLLARTAKAEQAQSLLDTVEALQTVGKAFLSGSKRPENKVLVRMVENARIGKAGNDVTIELTIPQGDIDILIASFH